MTLERSSCTVGFVNGRVVRYRVDAVGNHLNAVLWWCETHAEPVWVYSDGSYECPEVKVTGWDQGNHVIVDPPWSPEAAQSNEEKP